RRDQGWSWVVLFTAFIAAILFDDLTSGFGVVYKNIHNNSKARNYTDSDYPLPRANYSACYVVASK
ncbi:unnamed protein product, partial [Hymenolepis diminuta]